jgi:hypothetical protein
MQQENMLRPKFINYATAIMTEINPPINYGRSTFGMICRLSEFHKNKPFRDTTREDAVAFLDSLRKTEKTHCTSGLEHIALTGFVF